jgi:hypothetical protein
MRWIGLLISLALPQPALAGPWPRAQGEGFLSFTSSLPAALRSRPDRMEAYAEFGLRPRLTLAAGLEFRPAAKRLDLLARWHPPDLPLGLVWGIGLGLRLTPDDSVRHRAMLGLDLGHGFQTGMGNVWTRAGIRLLAGRGPDGMERDLDLSAQIGLRRGAWIGMVGLTQYRNRWGNQTRLRPALGYEVSPRLTLTGEAVLAPGIGYETLRLSLWSRF